MVLAGALAAPAVFSAQQTAPAVSANQDHQDMMDQLGIKALRPGPSGDDQAPNHANYDPAKANPFPTLPDPLTLNNGVKVTTPEMWWKQRRPELVEMFEREVYGRVPAKTPRVTWRVVATDHEMIGFGNPVIAKDLIGEVDNSSDPSISVKIHMTLVTPSHATGPVPVLMMYGRAGFPAPQEPNSDEFDRVNAAWKAMVEQQDPSLKSVFDKYPAWQPVKPTPFAFPQLNEDGGPPNTWQLIADGWGFALLDPASVQADNGEGLRSGIIGLMNHGGPRKPDDWGTLRAWAWGAGRGLDYLETDSSVDARHVGIEGVSRYGKAALVTMAFDQRFAMALVGSSGKGGATLMRRNWGEAVESLTGSEYYWMAGNFLKYGASEIDTRGMTTAGKTPGDLPVDSNELIALCAPRLTFISYGIPAKGDARWLDQEGSFMATVDAGRVFTLLGARPLDLEGDYKTAKMPPVNEGHLAGELAWRQHDGGHTDAPNMKYFLLWADKFIRPAPQ